MQQTVVCRKCNSLNYANQQFCMACGIALAAHCPSCCANVPLSYRFCGVCGTPLNEEGKTTIQVPRAQINHRLETNWFKRHLNWTYFIGLIMVQVVAYAIAILLVPFQMIAIIIGLAILLGGTFSLAYWTLNQKDRNYLASWAFWSMWIWFIPLLLNNEKGVEQISNKFVQRVNR